MKIIEKLLERVRRVRNCAIIYIIRDLINVGDNQAAK